MNPTAKELAFAEERRPGITAIFDELKRDFPKLSAPTLLVMAKQEWQKKHRPGGAL